MNWGALKSAVAAFANRTDLTAQMTTFRDLAEQRIFNGDEANRISPLRHPRMLSLATLTPSSGVAALPSDYLEVKRLTSEIGGRTYSLHYRSPDLLGQYELISGTPEFFTVRGSNVVLGPSFTSGISLYYYARPATPSADSDENWIMSVAPSLYLYGMLADVGLFLRDDSLIQTSITMYQSAAASLQSSGNAHAWGGQSALSIATD